MKQTIPKRKMAHKRRLKRYDLVDDDDKKIAVGTVSEALSRKLARRAVHIFVFNKKNELLICKRPAHTRAYPNLYTSSAGGKVERGESYREAAMRELYEELGIRAKLSHIGRFDVKSPRHGKMIHHLFAASLIGKIRFLEHEIAAHEFLNLKKLRKDVARRPRRYTAPFREALKLYLESTDK